MRLRANTSGVRVYHVCLRELTVHARRSKSELKKRTKQRQLAERKKEKEQSKPAPALAKAQKASAVEEDESNLTPNVRNRCQIGFAIEDC